nr:mechanosensitive ion channel [Burkholderiales bacterium]
TLYREYLRDYLAKNPYINHNYTTVIRHLDSSVNGLPIEVYTFTKDVTFVEYENVQSEIFEHCFSVVSQFGLKILQYPNI